MTLEVLVMTLNRDAKCGWAISSNLVYWEGQTIEEALQDMEPEIGWDDEEKVWAAECVQAGSLFVAVAFPDTPTSFVRAMGPTIDLAISRLVESL